MDFGDTIFASAVALNGRGDSVAAPIRWADLDTIVRIDSLSGTIVARFTGTGQIQARTGTLRSNPQPITVFLRADTAFADSTPATDSVSIAGKRDSLSDSLRIRVQTFDTTGAAIGLSGRRVTWSLLYPPDTNSFKFSPVLPITTDLNGLGVVQIKLHQRTLPDSAVVQATVTRFNGATVPGMPVTFVVRFYP
ncbi:MAG TPA: hypothetical protein VNX15_07485 [Gemmatimonadales bacterium]|jgi:hypothetical protein|nr:hypothetical protein [Gemmatimonadales bacterium]